MATVTRPTREIPLSEYPTGNGKPMAETPFHGEIMFGLRQILQDHFAEDPMVYVSGNLMMYYVKNNKSLSHKVNKRGVAGVVMV
jgi:hypothetical protein